MNRARRYAESVQVPDANWFARILTFLLNGFGELAVLVSAYPGLDVE